MTYYDEVPAGDSTGDWWSWSDEEREAFLTETFSSIAEFDYDRRHFHDTNGWYAELAGSEKCLALGHHTSPVGDTEIWMPAPEHPWSWDGEPLCEATRYGQACTYCEGECEYIQERMPVLWALAGVVAA